MDVQVFSLDVLKRSQSMTSDPLDQEHVASHIRRHPEIFSHLNIVAPHNLHWPELGLTLDEHEDYLLLKEIIEHFLPKGWFPRTEEKLRSHGLWSTEARMKRYRKELWEGKTEDQTTLSYATCLGLEVMENLSVLDYDLNLTSGESLIVKKSLINSEKVHSLLSCLKERILEKAKIHNELLPSF